MEPIRIALISIALPVIHPGDPDTAHLAKLYAEYSK